MKQSLWKLNHSIMNIYAKMHGTNIPRVLLKYEHKSLFYSHMFVHCWFWFWEKTFDTLGNVLLICLHQLIDQCCYHPCLLNWYAVKSGTTCLASRWQQRGTNFWEVETPDCCCLLTYQLTHDLSISFVGKKNPQCALTTSWCLCPQAKELIACCSWF